MDLFAKIGGLVLLVTFLGFQTNITEGLLCYQCIDADNNTKCRDAGLLLKDTRDEFDTNKLNYNQYVKDCDSERTNNTMCMIETFLGAQFGKVKSYMRDCSDGYTFSFNVEKFKRLSILVADNQTTCVYDETGFGTAICVTLCEGDMCNGPKQDFVTVNSTASALLPFVASLTLNAFPAGRFEFEVLFFVSVVFTRLFL